MNIQAKRKGFVMLHKNDVIFRLFALNDAEQRLYLIYVALADFKDTPDRAMGVVDVTFKELISQPLKSWSPGKLSRIRKSLIEKGYLSMVKGERKILVNHYLLYKTKIKDVELIFQLMKPGIPLTEQDLLLAKQKPIIEIKQAAQDLAQKFTISNNDVS